MPVLTRTKQALQYAGMATAAAPYMSKAASDRELRDGMRSTLRSLNRIYGEMTADERLRDRVFRGVPRVPATSLEAASRSSRNSAVARILRRAVIGAGLLAAGAAFAAALALAYPRSRRRITETVGDARQNVVSTIGRVRRRPAEQAGETAPEEASRAA